MGAFYRFIFIGALISSAGFSRPVESSGNALDPNWIAAQIESLPLSPLAGEVQKSGLTAAARNPAILKLLADNPNYTTELPTGSIMNQENTGNCWLYAALNVLRSRLYQENAVPLTFQFSPNYVYFYSLLEKVNLYLNTFISLRNADRRTLNLARTLAPLSKIQDGGWWENVVFLVEKYGLVPHEAMPDTFGSQNDGTLLSEIDDVVTATVTQMRKAITSPDPSLSDQAQLDQLEAIKANGVTNVLRVMQTHLGKPPTQFIYNGVTYTPLSFAQNFLKIDFSQYAHVASYPKLKNRHYVWKKSHIGVPTDNSPIDDVDFLNTTNDRMVELVTQSIKAGYAAWIGIDVALDTDSVSGIMHPQIFDRATAYNWPADQPFAASPGDRMFMGVLGADHNVALVGVDQPDPSQPPIKFKIENSWGVNSGTHGIFHMYREWFQQYVFDIEVPMSLLTPEERRLLNAPAKRIPAVNPS